MGFLDGGFGGLVGGVGSLAGGIVQGITSNHLANKNIAAQKEFAQNGIRWRVEDAKRAGIHPLYALGASTASFSPVQGYGGDYGISDALANFGQGIDRAAQAKMTREERERLDARQEMQDVFALARFQQEQRYQDARVRLIDSEIALNKVYSDAARRRAALPPVMPGSPTMMPGQGDAVKYKPDEVVMSGQEPSTTAGLHPLWNDVRNGPYINPVIDSNYGDSITESELSHAGAVAGYTAGAWFGGIRPPLDKFSKAELELLKTGDYVPVYTPFLGWRVERHPRSYLKKKYGYKNSGREFRGKIGR